MATDTEIARALDTLFGESDSNPNPNFVNSLDSVVHQLQSKLGQDLTHKVDFIRAQIQQRLLLLRSQSQPQRLFSLPKDPFAQQLNSNVLSHPSAAFTAQLQRFSLPPTAVLETKPEVAAAASVQGVEVVASVERKESVPAKAKRKGGPGGLNKLCAVSPELQTIVGQPELPRTEIVKQLWAYIRKNNLQDPSNKRKIICNDELRLVFETDCTDMFKMNKLLAKHISSLDPTKESSSKKLKLDADAGTKGSECGPSVIISEALANFFNAGGREMPQSEVIRRVWDYIKVNRLEDSVNSMVILCDAKLQELFGCESIPALGIPEMLTRHHLFNQ